MQGGGFHPWNPMDFTLKSGGFHHEIWQISPRFHLWNPPKIIKASVLAKTLQFDECRVGDFTLEIQWISTLKSGGFQPWNLVDFTQISPVKSTQNYKSKCFSKNSSVWWMQGGGYDQGFHLWNPAEFTQISSMKSTKNYKSKCFSKNSSVWWMQGGGLWPRISWNLPDFHMKSAWNLPISKLWAFAWWSSVGLSFFERPIRRVFAETSDFIRFGMDFMWNQKTSCKEL